MLYIACSAGIGILLFLIAYLGFRTGLRLGLQVSQGKLPPKIDPVGAALRTAANVKNAGDNIAGKKDPLTEHFEKMMAYDGNPAPAKTKPKE